MGAMRASIETAAGPANGQYRVAMDRAGRWLALRPRTEAELRTRLLEGGFDAEIVGEVLGRLRELNLVDDIAFAHQWIEERSSRKGLGSEALVAELENKGIERGVTEQVLAELGLDETAQAIALATKAVARMVDVPIAQQARRLSQLLARRGFPEEAVHAGLKAVLPPEGWD
jgi:regulatory protein